MTNRNKKSSKQGRAAAAAPDEAGYFQLLDEARDKKQYSKALTLATAACRAFPSNWDFLYIYAESLVNDGRERWRAPHFDALEKVERVCDALIGALETDSAIALREGNTDPYVLRAIALMYKGHRLSFNDQEVQSHAAYLEAERQFMDCLEMAPNHPLVLTGYGETLRRLGAGDSASGENFGLALESFRRAVEITPRDSRTFAVCSHGLALLLVRSEDYIEALDVLNRALTHFPEDGRLLKTRDKLRAYVNGEVRSKAAVGQRESVADAQPCRPPVLNVAPNHPQSVAPAGRIGRPLKL